MTTNKETFTTTLISLKLPIIITMMLFFRFPPVIITMLLHSDLKHYITYARKAYLEAIHTVKPNSDIVLDGSLSVSEIINYIVEELSRREVIVNG
ncbi:hypothetical protein BWGOE8_24430 [Bacillus mycoides]|uniref:Uncharacterized protein n=2 Tax=Bacillus mycoides TaxID=1405 RepID=A0A1E8B896_BACMY|nr:hypothetical protein [Bacillus mycoides]OFD79712.1 hypothetical protein BWGOE9_24480 [Bacillus mycoides]OFD80020.1 hypothetical protein BWGOE8_24430 [Bacillus mycoides]OFD81172.1 hypothetical protein BWGOE10_24860 [Bacillus mycoides]